MNGFSLESIHISDNNPVPDNNQKETFFEIMEDNIKSSKITIRDCSGPGFSAILKKFNINISNK